MDPVILAAIIGGIFVIIAAIIPIWVKRSKERQLVRRDTNEADETTESFPLTIELTIAPIPPDTIARVKIEIIPCIQEALRESGQERLLESGELKVTVERGVPIDLVATAIVTLLSNVALETFKTIVLPQLKKRFTVKAKKRTAKRK
jgi:hypothetical protein